MDNDNKKRRSINSGNRYERKIVLIAFTPAWIMLLGLFCSLLVVRQQVIKDVLQGRHVDYGVAFLTWIFHSYIYLLVGLCSLFIITVVWAYILARDLMGPFSRILPELDAIIEGRSRKLVHARTKDEFANELLKRINIFIQYYIDHKK